MVQSRDDIVGIDSSVILPRQVWEASGHVEVFSDPLVESLHTHKRYRADHLIEAYEAKHGRPPANGLADINDPDTGQPGAWTEPRNFSGLLKTFLGPVDDEEGMAYLRPETAQGIFVNFANVLSSAPHEAAVRHRPGRQELPQRDHAGQLHLPHARVRADGDGVLRRARHRRGVVRVLDRRLRGLVPRPRHHAREPPALRAPEREAVPLLEEDRRPRVPVPVRGQRVGRAHGRRQPHRLRPEDALREVGRRPVVLRPDQERALDPVRDRAGVRPHPRADGLPRRRLRRRRGAQHQGRRRQAHGAAPRPPPRAGQGRGAAALAQRAAVAGREGGRRRRCARTG